MNLLELTRVACRRYREFGAGYVLKKSMVGAVRPVCARLDYLRYRERYPTNLIFMAGLAKSGSTWLAAMLGDLPGFRVVTPRRMKLAEVSSWDSFENSNLYPEMIAELSKTLAVVKEHTWPFRENLKILHEAGMKYLITLRDPRDALISSYYDARRNHWHWDHQKAQAMELSGYLDDKLTSGEWNRICLAWMRGWLEHRHPGRSLLITYEKLNAEPAETLREVLRFLEFPVDEDWINQTAEKHGFTRSSGGRKPGEEAPEAFQRKGVSGEWKEVFTEEQKEIFLEQGGDVIGKLKFEG